MNSYDIFKGLSEIDEELIMKPRRFVSLRKNLVFCIIAANVSGFISHSDPAVSIAVYIAAFAAMYAFAAWFMNRKKKRKLINEKDSETSDAAGRNPQ